MKRHLSRAASFLGIIAILIVWMVAYDSELVSRLVLASPQSVLMAMVNWGRAVLWVDLFYTLERLGLSVSIGTLLGVLLGVPLSRVPWLLKATLPIITFFRAVPAIALFPFFAVVFGIGEMSKVASITYGVLFLMTLYTIQGIMTVDRVLLAFPRTILQHEDRARFWLAKEILIPAALPTILFGLRLSVPIALVVTVATEMFFGTTHGLGSRIIIAQLAYRLPDAWAAILVTGLLGYVLNTATNALERKYSFWVGQ